jgi:hypothetical protein
VSGQVVGREGNMKVGVRDHANFRSGVGWAIIPAGSSIFSVNMRGECVPFGQGSVRHAHHTQQEVALSLGVPARCHDEVDVESN